MFLSEYIEDYKPKGFNVDYYYAAEPNRPYTKLPKTPSISIHPSIERYISHVREHKFYPFYVANCSDLTVTASNNFGSVSVSHNENIFKDISTRYEFNVDQESDFRSLSGKSVLLSMDSAANYFHWLCQVLPRIDLLRQHRVNLSEIDNFLIPSIKPKFIKESLNYFGIKDSQLIYQTENTDYIFSDIIVPCKPNRNIHISNWSIDFLNNEFLVPKKFNKKIYIHRDSSNGRNIFNEEEVYTLLDSLGFVKVELENFSIQDQASIFNDADVIVSPHGASLANLVFCRKGTKVIELFNSSYFSPLYWNMSNIKDLDYYYIQSEGEVFSPPEDKIQSIKIDLSSLKSIINYAGKN